jgi:unsaturated rhamnogalacturonyl hydrolase
MPHSQQLNRSYGAAGFVLLLLILACPVLSQQVTDSNTPLHLLQPEYEIPYGIPEADQIEAVLQRITAYLEKVTPAALADAGTGEVIGSPDALSPDRPVRWMEGDFRLVSYEWGVTYAGMLLATEATGNPGYASYTFERLRFLGELYPRFLELEQDDLPWHHPMERVLHPRALDDAGSMCAAMIKAGRAGGVTGLDPMIRNFIDYIMHGQFRLEDGTLARNRPQPNSLWLDDLFMSVPALAQMGAYTGELRYFDEAVKQVMNVADRMFNEDAGLFMHGWIMGMGDHPSFYWARANGWALMAMVELLEVLPGDHPGRTPVMHLLQNHIRGLAAYQSPSGFWHQLIDRNDSYLETSATAIYTYAMARAINRGYVDAKVYGPVVCLAWNAVTSKVNERGQVEGTCVGTGMGFDPAFYYYRPVSPYAAHGYGPVLLAGAEMITLLDRTHPKMNDSAIQFYDREVESDAPIFNVEGDLGDVRR